MAQENLHIGIDGGSTTVKLAILDEQRQVHYAVYRRHHADVRATIIEVLGEGGSGGALALAVANQVAIQENAVYSVLSPEGFASILWKDRSRAAEAAQVMGMSAADVAQLGVADVILPEGAGPAHENPDQAVAEVRRYVAQALERLEEMSPDQLVEQRQARFAQF